MSCLDELFASAPDRAGPLLTVHAPGAPARALDAEALGRMVESVAAWLAHIGLRRGDRLGILAPNGLEWILLDLAALRLGLVTAGFEPESFSGRSDLCARYGLARLVHAEPCPASEGAGDAAIPVSRVLAAASEPAAASPPPVRYSPDDVVTIKFTSGSTGEAKGLGATVASIEQSLTSVQSLFRHGPDDTLLVFLPLSLLQQRYWIYSALLFGHAVVVTTSARVFEAMRIEAPSVVMGVPVFFDALKTRIEDMAESLPAEPGEAVRQAARRVMGPNVRYLWTGSAPARPDVLAFFDEACGTPLFEGYGMNETCIVSKNHPGAHRRGSVGRPLDGIDLALDAEGGLLVKRRCPVNTAYLFAAPGVSERVFGPGGTVRTGDLAWIDDDGYLYILGRADDVVVLESGRNVAVRAIEEAIERDPRVQAAIVLGSGRAHLGAIVCPSPGTSPEAAAAAARGAVADGKGPGVVAVVVASEPFSATNGLLTSQGKPRRSTIAARYATEIERAYGGPR